jgi:RNAse (barnase) inhibitor barstar
MSSVIIWNMRTDLKELFLDGAGWQTKDDVYDAFFRAVGAPDWHGRNLDVLNDSIANGSMNGIEVPYCLVIKRYDQIGGVAKKVTNDFVALIHEIAARGCPVEIRLESHDSARLPE